MEDIKTPTNNSLLDYRATIGANREVFLINFRQEFNIFAETIAQLDAISNVVKEARDHNGHTQISLIPWIGIISRQFQNSFDCISTYRSYDAWLLLRPAVEAVLIIGKWLDDRTNADIWRDREKDKDAWKRYKSTYEGKALISKSLANSAEIRSVLSHMNDDFMHGNAHYYYRHIDIQTVDADNMLLHLRFTDTEAEHKAGLYSFLHFTAFLVHSLAYTLQDLYGPLPQLQVSVDKVQNWLADRICILVRASPESQDTIANLGLWP